MLAKAILLLFFAFGAYLLLSSMRKVWFPKQSSPVGIRKVPQRVDHPPPPVPLSVNSQNKGNTRSFSGVRIPAVSPPRSAWLSEDRQLTTIRLLNAIQPLDSVGKEISPYEEDIAAATKLLHESLRSQSNAASADAVRAIGALLNKEDGKSSRVRRLAAALDASPETGALMLGFSDLLSTPTRQLFMPMPFLFERMAWPQRLPTEDGKGHNYVARESLFDVSLVWSCQPEQQLASITITGQSFSAGEITYIPGAKIVIPEVGRVFLLIMQEYGWEVALHGSANHMEEFLLSHGDQERLLTFGSPWGPETWLLQLFRAPDCRAKVKSGRAS